MTNETRNKLLELTIEELRYLCKKNNIQGYSRLNKQDLIDLIIISYGNYNFLIKFPSKKDFIAYGISWCPYCIKLKNLLKKNLNENQYDYYDIEEDLNLEIPYFKALIKEKTNDYKYVPIVFFKNNFLGGYNETESLLKKNIYSKKYV